MSSDVIRTAHEEMDKWGLIERGWVFNINATARRLGQYSPLKQLIEISKHHIEHDSSNHVLQTIRHEIAHALHYLSYVDAGRERDFFATRWTGKRWVRKVKPHGAEWKRFARLVGVDEPSASSATNMAKNMDWKWHLVSVVNGLIHDENNGYHRFPKRLSCKWFRGRKTQTKGRLYLVRGDHWRAYKNGSLQLTDLPLYQDCNYRPALRAKREI